MVLSNLFGERRIFAYVTLSEDTQFLYGSKNPTITPKVTVLETESPSPDSDTVTKENKKEQHPISKKQRTIEKDINF